jgi:hypothetical protein
MAAVFSEAADLMCCVHYSTMFTPTRGGQVYLPAQTPGLLTSNMLLLHLVRFCKLKMRLFKIINV